MQWKMPEYRVRNMRYKKNNQSTHYNLQSASEGGENGDCLRDRISHTVVILYFVLWIDGETIQSK